MADLFKWDSDRVTKFMVLARDQTETCTCQSSKRLTEWGLEFCSDKADLVFFLIKKFYCSLQKAMLSDRFNRLKKRQLDKNACNV